MIFLSTYKSECPCIKKDINCTCLICYFMLFQSDEFLPEKIQRMLEKQLEHPHYNPGRLPRSVPQEAQSNLKSSSHFPRLPCCHVLSVVSSNYCRLSARPGARPRQLYPSPGTWLSTAQVIRPFPWPLDHTPTYSKATGRAVFTQSSCSLTSPNVMLVLSTGWRFTETQSRTDWDNDPIEVYKSKFFLNMNLVVLYFKRLYMILIESAFNNLTDSAEYKTQVQIQFYIQELHCLS